MTTALRLQEHSYQVSVACLVKLSTSWLLWDVPACVCQTEHSAPAMTRTSCPGHPSQLLFLQAAYSLEAAMWCQTAAQLRNRSRVLGLRLPLEAEPVVASGTARALSASQGSTLTQLPQPASASSKGSLVFWPMIYLAAVANLG
jgi:hypothetical protein